MTAVETTTNRGYRPDYGSVLRDASAILALATDSKAKPEIISTAMSAIEVERARTSYASTQDMSWMVLAARAIVREAENITLDDNGTAHRGALNKTFTASELEKDVRIVNTGQGCGPGRGRRHRLAGCRRARSAATASTISRNYYTPDGEPVDPSRGGAEHAARRRAHGDEAQGSESLNGNFLLVDALPAGFEIENPTLISSGSTAGLPWLSDTELRALHRVPRRPLRGVLQHLLRQLAYMVRAVAPGRYVHPGAFVEDMYRPEVNARTATGSVTVKSP